MNQVKREAAPYRCLADVGDATGLQRVEACARPSWSSDGRNEFCTSRIPVECDNGRGPRVDGAVRKMVRVKIRGIVFLAVGMVLSVGACGGTAKSTDSQVFSGAFPTEPEQVMKRLVYDLRGLGCSVAQPELPTSLCVVSVKGNVNTATIHVFGSREDLDDFMDYESRRLQANGDPDIHLISGVPGAWAIETDGLAGNQVYDVLNTNDPEAGAKWAYP